jgi:GT2 family glycosyltransferase
MIEANQISAVIVTYHREDLLKRVISQVINQTSGRPNLYVVDNGNEESVEKLVLDNGGVYITGDEKAGGAGGYSAGMKRAISDGCSYIWTLDDDGFPELNCLAELTNTLQRYELEMVVPLAISSSNLNLTANPYLIGFQKINGVAYFKRKNFWPKVSQLFNGMLIASNLVNQVGYPHAFLFIRGDELDYYERIKNSKVRFGMSTKAQYQHPSSSGEFPGNNPTHFLGVVLPTDGKKLYYQIRNRGYLQREHHLYKMLIADWIKYPLHFILKKSSTELTLKSWFQIWLLGFRKIMISYEDYQKSAGK